jgi:hypothetical protein
MLVVMHAPLEREWPSGVLGGEDPVSRVFA